MIKSSEEKNIDEKVILVLEDEKPLAEAIKTKLQNSGFGVTTARTVEQALNYLDDISDISAIWLDHYLLGKENGLDFIAKLKQRGGKWAKIPIFVVSNTASNENVRSYIQFGVNKYYVKAEHRLDEIISEIRNILENPEE